MWGERKRRVRPSGGSLAAKQNLDAGGKGFEGAPEKDPVVGPEVPSSIRRCRNYFLLTHVATPFQPRCSRFQGKLGAEPGPPEPHGPALRQHYGSHAPS